VFAHGCKGGNAAPRGMWYTAFVKVVKIMSKKSGISLKLDMRAIEKKFTDSAKNVTSDYRCPKCHRPISIHSGLTQCPYCGQLLEVEAPRPGRQ
jgi:ribosomal protein L37AE/L43A